MKKKFELKKLLWKFAKNSIYVVIAGLAVLYGDSPYYLAVLPIIKGVENYIKHK